MSGEPVSELTTTLWYRGNHPTNNSGGKLPGTFRYGVYSLAVVPAVEVDEIPYVRLPAVTARAI